MTQTVFPNIESAELTIQMVFPEAGSIQLRLRQNRYNSQSIYDLTVVVRMFAIFDWYDYLCANDFFKTNFIWTASYSIKMILSLIHDWSIFPIEMNRFNSNPFLEIDPIQLMTQAASENIYSNQSTTKKETIRFESTH